MDCGQAGFWQVALLEGHLVFRGQCCPKVTEEMVAWNWYTNKWDRAGPDGGSKDVVWSHKVNKDNGNQSENNEDSPDLRRFTVQAGVQAHADVTLTFRKLIPDRRRCLLHIIVGETAVFCLQLATRDFENQEKTILTGDCCYINPLVRRTVRFLGIYTFGLFATDIFVNAGQVVTGNLAPHFLALCKPNYTALGCQQYTQFISGEEACTGNPDLIMRARKTFPSKEAALSVYAAMYLTMYITNTIKAKGTRLAKPVLCLGLMCLAFLTGLNRVAEYRNHWSDVIAGFLVGISIAVFLVVCVVNNFKGRQPENEHIHMDNLAQMPMISIPRVESPLEKVTSVQVSRIQPIENGQEETSQGRSFKDCFARLFSWILGLSHCEHLQLRQ
eukprot:XP_022276403.1 phospholipid phosphatase-related protein type 5 [Canis lupus familiaris]